MTLRMVQQSLATAVICGLFLGLGLVTAGPVQAHNDQELSAAQRCFAYHRFGVQPVDVAKSSDSQTVLAQASWAYHDAIGCYLTLDDGALAALRAAPPPQSLPDAQTDASTRCFGQHQFGQRPVDVAKSADSQTVLARLSWGYHDAIGCYLTLDDEALTALRTANAQPTPTPEPAATPTPEPTMAPEDSTAIDIANEDDADHDAPIPPAPVEFDPYLETNSSSVTVYLDDYLCRDGGSAGQFGVPQFSDVDPSRPEAPHIKCMRALGLYSGIEDDAYRPDEQMTRAEAAEVLSIMWVLSSGGGVCPSDISTFAGCLAAAGIIEKGQADEFSPDEPLSGDDLVLWLHRLFQAWRGDSRSGGRIGIGQVCRQTGTEMQRAQACLNELGVIGAPQIIAAQATVTRATAAVHMANMQYVLTLYANPTKERREYVAPGYTNQIKIDLDPQVNLPVFYCAPPGTYTSADLNRLIEILNEDIAESYSIQSSGLLEVTFTHGGIIEPDRPWNLIWPEDVLTGSETLGVAPEDCTTPAVEQAGTSQVIILVNPGRAPNPSEVGGRAYLATGPAAVYLYPQADRSPQDGVERIDVLRHEVDHSLLGISHINFCCGGTRAVCLAPSSLETPREVPEGYHGFITGCIAAGDPSSLVNLQGSPILTCYDRQRLEWPVGNNFAVCARFGPSRPSVVSLTFDGDGSVVAEIGAPVWSDDAEITGYSAYLYRWFSSHNRWQLHNRAAVNPQQLMASFVNLQRGEVYELVVVAESEYGQGLPGHHRFIAMATPEQIEVTEYVRRPLESVGDVSFELTVPEVPNAVEYHVQLLGQDVTLQNSSSHRIVPGNVMQLSGWTDFRWLDHTYEMRIFACAPFGQWGPGIASDGAQVCLPYARYVLDVPPPTLPLDAPPTPSDGQGTCQMGPDDELSPPVFRVTTNRTNARLEWDPAPCVTQMTVRNPDHPDPHTASAGFYVSPSELSHDLLYLISPTPGAAYELEVHVCRGVLDESGFLDYTLPHDCQTVSVPFTLKT